MLWHCLTVVPSPDIRLAKSGLNFFPKKYLSASMGNVFFTVMFYLGAGVIVTSCDIRYGLHNDSCDIQAKVTLEVGFI